MKEILLITLTFYLIGCSRTTNHKDNESTNETVDVVESKPNDYETNSVFVDETKFKFEKLESFDLTDWYYGNRQKGLKTLTKDEIFKYFKNTELQADLENNEDDIYYFSIQLNSPNRKIITLIEEYDVCCADLIYLVYDKDNNLVSKNKVAGTGGDGEWGYNEYGKFLSDTEYQLIRVDNEQVGSDPNKDIYQIDSVVTTYSVDNNLKFKKTDEKVYKYRKGKHTTNYIFR